MKKFLGSDRTGRRAAGEARPGESGRAVARRGRSVWIAGSLALTGVLGAEEAWRTFTSPDGRELVGRVIEASDEGVRLERRTDRRVFTLTMDQFSEEDQAYLRELKTGPETAPEEAPSFGAGDPEAVDYFPDLAEGKTHEAQHFPLGPIGGVIAVPLGGREAEVKALAPGGPGEAAGLEVGDVLTGTGNGRFGELAADPSTGGDGLPEDLGEAILRAQEEGRSLELRIDRAGEDSTVSVELPQMPSFAKDYPRDCERSSVLAASACNWLARAYGDHGNFATGDMYSNSFAALALLASGGGEYRSILREFAHRVAGQLETNVDTNNWRSSAMGIFLAEYHLATGDDRVLEGLKAATEALAERVDAETGRMGHDGFDLPYEGKGLVITSAHAHLLWALAAEAGIPLDRDAWDLSYRSVEAAIGPDGNVGYNFSATGSTESMARTGLMATGLEISGESSSDLRGMNRWLGDNVKRATNGHTVTSMGLIFGFMGAKNAGEREHRDFFDYHRWMLAQVTPVDPRHGAYYYGLRTNIGGDGYLGFRTVGNYTTALILHSARGDTLWSFGNRQRGWYETE